MSFLAITLPASLLLAAVLVALVIHHVRQGGFDDLEAPAARLLFDDDATPELDREVGPSAGSEPPHEA